MAILFEQVHASNLYQASGGGPTAWCGYMLAPGAQNPDASFSTEDALNTYGGSFLFAPQAPSFATDTEANAFVGAVQTWLAGPGTFFGQYCAWLPKAAVEPVFGAPSFNPANANYFAFQFTRQAAGLTLQSTFNALVGSNLWLSLAAGVFIDAEGDALTFYGPLDPGIGFVKPQALQFSIPSKRATLPLSGPSAGALVVSGALTIASDLGGLLIGMRYAYGDATTPGVTVTQAFQMLDVAASPRFDVVVALDPLDPLCIGPASYPGAGVYRTRLAAAPGTGALASFYLTANNAPLALTPRSAADPALGPAAYDGGFVFQPVGPLRIGSNELPVQTDVYLAPAGDYLTSAEGAGAIVTLMAGLAGSETFALQGAGHAGADALRFVGARPAYTPQFPLPEANIADPASGVATAPLPAPEAGGLPSYVTSWVQIAPGDGSTPTYSAQPDGSPLYGPGGAFSQAGKAVVGALRPTTTIGSTSFPMAPWRGAQQGGAPTADWSLYESQVLSATRRQILQSHTQTALRALKAGLAADEAAPIQPNGTTPQGLLAEIGQSGGLSNYKGVILAQSDDQGTPYSQMAFRNVGPQLQGLFQTNQLFAVITNPAPLGAFDNYVDIAGWKMQAKVGVTSPVSNISNVLIFKFCKGTLRDLVQTPSAWTDPADFSNPDPGIGVAVLSQALKDYIDLAAAAAKAGNTLYQNFVDIVCDPEWCGILVLGAHISPTDLPPQLAGLAAGINFTNFRAHHFGVSVSPVHYDGQTLTIPNSSSLFGLVDYQLPAFAQSVAAGASPTLPLALSTSGPYDFTVLQLQSLFENSALVDFRSHVQVTANTLFGSKVTAAYAAKQRQAANSVVLTGYYQNQGGQGTYLFESDQPTVMTADSNVLPSVVINKVVFNTLTNDDKGSPPQILSRILMWGAFNFTVLSGPGGAAFDLMSYGMPAGSDPSAATGGLAFSNLIIDMASPVATPNVTTYAMVESSLAFDLPNSTVRENGLVEALALQPQGFLVAPAGTTPGARGYLPVILDEGAPAQAAVSQPWYGLSCQINMGGPGALAAAAGFTSTMLLAWSPQSLASAKGYAVFCGLQLPGAAPGASAFSLQGVIQLKVDTISLSLAPVAGGGTNAFTLRLSDIALSFLGLKKLPSDGSIDLFIFGSPDKKGSLGWYGAYVEDQGKAAIAAEGAAAA